MRREIWRKKPFKLAYHPKLFKCVTATRAGIEMYNLFKPVIDARALITARGEQRQREINAIMTGIRLRLYAMRSEPGQSEN